MRCSSASVVRDAKKSSTRCAKPAEEANANPAATLIPISRVGDTMIGDLISGGLKFLGGMFDRDTAKDTAAQNIALQKEFAQSGIQWKVQDAKKAGVHPLYALGASTHSFAPVSVGSNMSEALGGAGQDISRAINSTRSTEDRMDAFTRTSRALAVEKMGLENQLLQAQIAKLNQAGAPPAMPIGNRYLIDGQGATTLVKDEPLERTPAQPGKPHSEPGAITSVGYGVTPSGGMEPVPSKDMKERIEDDIIAQASWFVRNRILPTFGFNEAPPAAPLPDGYQWRFHPFKQEYRPARRDGRWKIWK